MKHYKTSQIPYLQVTCAASSTGWQLQTPLGSLEAGDLPSTRSIRTYGPKVRNIQGSGAPVSIDRKLAQIKSVKMTDFWLNWWLTRDKLDVNASLSNRG